MYKPQEQEPPEQGPQPTNEPDVPPPEQRPQPTNEPDVPPPEQRPQPTNEPDVPLPEQGPLLVDGQDTPQTEQERQCGQDAHHRQNKNVNADKMRYLKAKNNLRKK